MRDDPAVAEHELLDVFDATGAHAGVKDRAAVHRDGDWHAAFHLWVVSAGGVILQRRARTKASWPGRLDATAAGHLLAGESVADGMREVAEELGVTWPFADLVALGTHPVEDRERPGIVNRERQHVFAVRDDRALERYDAFDRAELEGLVLVARDGFAALAHGAQASVAATAWDGARSSAIAVRAAELVPSPYLASLSAALAALGATSRSESSRSRRRASGS
jgi:isopentenyldiphosphate isomerase